MGDLKTIAGSLILGLTTSLQAIPALADTGSRFEPSDQLRHFAVCAGRLSALMEHQWMFDGPASEDTAVQRKAVLAVLEAIATEGDRSRVMAWRIDAKAAHRALLAQATFSSDPDRARRAELQSDRLVGECSALVLS